VIEDRDRRGGGRHWLNSSEANAAGRGAGKRPPLAQRDWDQYSRHGPSVVQPPTREMTMDGQRQ